MSANIIITNIKPTNGLFASFQPRSKEGEEKRQPVFAAYELPVQIANAPDSDLRTFAVRAYDMAVTSLLKDALKDGKAEFTVPGIANLFEPAKREFLITRKDLEAWIIECAMPCICAALSAKSGLHIDSPKIIKKAIAYKEILLSIAGRSIMGQADIDASIRVLELVAALPEDKQHSYTDNVAQGIERQQTKLNEFLASGSNESEDDLDF